MQINDLKDDCLLAIFDQFNQLPDLFNCSQVCRSWARLIVTRLRKVKYALGVNPIISDIAYVQCIPNAIYFESAKDWMGIKISELLPNLKFLNLAHPQCIDRRMKNVIKYLQLVRIGANAKSLRGLAFTRDEERPCVAQAIDHLEVVVCDYVYPFFHDPDRANKLKQLSLYHHGLSSLAKFSSNLVNLVRLHLRNTRYEPESAYQGSLFPKLKIFEFCENHCASFYGFQFMDHCPVLESAFLSSDSDHWAAGKMVNPHLRDLVILRDFRSEIIHQSLTNFPNLKHLAIRFNIHIVDEDIKAIVQLLPSLELLDVRASIKITSESAAFVEQFCKRNRREITFYLDDDKRISCCEENSLLDPFSEVGLGFDFMKNCFFKLSLDLPYFLDPIDGYPD